MNEEDYLELTRKGILGVNWNLMKNASILSQEMTADGDGNEEFVNYVAKLLKVREEFE